MEVKTPLKAIRAKCLDCSNGQIVEVRECVIPNCPLWPYRMGMRPKTAEKAAEKRKARNCTTKAAESEKREKGGTSSAKKGTSKREENT